MPRRNGNVDRSRETQDPEQLTRRFRLRLAAKSRRKRWAA